MSNVVSFRAPTPAAPSLSRHPLRFTPEQRNALIACAMSLPGDVEAVFDDDDDGDQSCALMPGDGGYAQLAIHAGPIMAPWDSHFEALATSPDVAAIVAAVHRVAGRRVG